MQEIEFLIQHKGLVINEQEEADYFVAPLWGTTETAAKDAVIVFTELHIQRTVKLWMWSLILSNAQNLIKPTISRNKKSKK